MSKRRTVPLAGTLVIHEDVLGQPPGTWYKKVVWDLHGTLVDWLTPFCQFVNSIYKRDLTPAQIHLYLFGYQAHSPINNVEFNEAFYLFAEAQGRLSYGGLEPYPGAVEAMLACADAGIEQEIWTWTPGASEISFNHGQPFHTCPAQGETLALIERLGLPVDVRSAVRFIPGFAKPRTMAEELIPLLVDDVGATVLSAVDECGVGAILCTQPYNAGLSHDRLIRWGDPRHPENQDRTGLGDLIVAYFDKLDQAGVLVGSER